MSVNLHGRKLVLRIDNHPKIKNVKSFKKELIEEAKKNNKKELISKIIDSINMNSLNTFQFLNKILNLIHLLFF